MREEQRAWMRAPDACRARKASAGCRRLEGATPTAGWTLRVVSASASPARLGVFQAFAGYDPGGTAAPALFGRPQWAWFDVDCDGRVDMYDFYGLQTCFGAVTQPCLALFDYDASGTVDWPDAGQFGQTAGSPAMAAWQRRIVPSRYGNPFMWTGQRFDAATGQYHFWARTYSPHLGRWLQRDPLGYVDGTNVYQYVRSHPLVELDPIGLHTKAGGFTFKKGGVGDHPGEPTHWHVYDGNEYVGIVDEHGNTRGVRNASKMQRAVKAARKIGLIAGAMAIGLLVDEVFGAAVTLQDVKESPHYDRFLQALADGDWELADQLADLIYQHVLGGCQHRTCIDVRAWLQEIIDKRRAQFKAEQEKGQKEASASSWPYMLGGWAGVGLVHLWHWWFHDSPSCGDTASAGTP